MWKVGNGHLTILAWNFQKRAFGKLPKKVAASGFCVGVCGFQNPRGKPKCELPFQRARALSKDKKVAHFEMATCATFGRAFYQFGRRFYVK